MKRAEKTTATTTVAPFTFTPNAITFAGNTEAATYSIDAHDHVWVHTNICAAPSRMHFAPGHAMYDAVLAAAKSSSKAKKADPAPAVTPEKQPEAKQPAPATPVKPAEKPAAPKPVAPVTAPDPKPAPAAEQPKTKLVPGKTIDGKGWTILFDENVQRTRVIFAGDPTDAQKKAVEDAGFYWSNAMKSWNKKLSVKAARAAEALAVTLKALV